MSAFLELDGLTRDWGAGTGVRELSLSVERGAFVVLLGPSGCGKSTTLRLVAGLERADAGAVRIAGRDVTHAPPSARGLSMVFQSYALFPHLSVAENITFGLRVRRVGRAERDRLLAQALETTGLSGLEGRRPAQLSGGQRQRVALARAIVSDHPLCLMDEPLSNLDAKLRHAVRQDIRALQRRLGLTVLYVTHDQTEAMGMADRVVLMKGGRIEQAAAPEVLYERPATGFAATFLGAPPMALLPVTALPGALRPAGALPPGAVLGVRPEAIALAEPGPGTLAATVESAEFLGAETLVYLACGAEAGHARLIARLPGRGAPRPGAAVGLSWPAAAAHVFESPEGPRLPVSTPVSPPTPSHRMSERQKDLLP
ncbi:ABC transporter ATP-binding protein (plasmid) [Paroceanicella profunda]|uniref:ABC transporter ATP-binding protein n=1 Tax=Paroceanicella profunda TaxID=2579971 RepID=A0A5B8FJ63_9RHOB|nr:ABC transporter ATP-binding protein [Paroceanicella profunda]QDL94561.1 ABC transporter ATP-binding protein [Paroceanicella profunda]